MKKVFCLLLSLLMLLSLCACGAAEGGSAAGETTAAAVSGMQVGYGKVNITPDMSLPLQGYGNTSMRMSDGFMDYLYATCFAVTDESGNTAILFGIDMCGTANNLYITAREKISMTFPWSASSFPPATTIPPPIWATAMSPMWANGHLS